MTDMDFKRMYLGFQILSGFPNKLYKYRAKNDNNLDALKNHKMWFSDRNSFDDLYEGNIHLDAESIINELEKLDPFCLSVFGRQELLKELKEWAISFRDQYLVSCFSKRPTIDAMWGLYADSNKGYCLEFDVLKDPLFFSPLIPVIYKEALETTNFNNLFAHLFQRKHSSWIFQDEIRILSDKNYQEYNPASLSSVIFGERTSEQDIDEISTILGDSVDYKQIIKRNDKYSLEVIDIIL